MNLNSKIPKDFYKVFSSKYLDYYEQFLVAIYEESMRSYSLLGLTERECRAVMNEKIALTTLAWDEDQYDEEGEMLSRSNMASICLKHLEDWGWLRRDYDESLNTYVVSFPEYSQIFVELFQKLRSEETNQERESVLAVYSYLYTYNSDKEKNNDILRSALQTSKNLLRMLVNMQESMRGYFDELSRQRSFLGIQEVLVKEINNSDSMRYAILTTTDGFYRYKEAVKELIDENMSDNEVRRQDYLDRKDQMERDYRRMLKSLNPDVSQPMPLELDPAYRRVRKQIERCEEAVDLMNYLGREFDGIERRYNMLIEQKTVFASRAAARIRYVLMEGDMKEDQTAQLASILAKSDKQEEILEKLTEKLQLTERFRVMNDQSLYHRKAGDRESFSPQALAAEQTGAAGLDSFVLKPLYTRQEIGAFRDRNTENGAFRVTKNTVQSMEDLEKLFFVWQEATEIAEAVGEISVGEDLENESGYRYSKLEIR